MAPVIARPARRLFNASLWRAVLRIVSPSPDPMQNSDGIHPHSRRAHPQFKEHQPRSAAQPVDRDHRAVRLGQVLTRLRHLVCRGSAALRRIAVGLRPAVFAVDGEAGCRPDRRAVAGDFHRAESDFAQPALDGRHRHRNPRLPAPALRPRRHAVLPGAQPAAGGADGVADGRCRAGAAGRNQADDPRPGGRQPQGRADGSVRRIARPGFCAGPRRRHGLRDRRRAEAGQDAQAQRRCRRRPPEGARRHAPAPGRILRDGAAPCRRTGHRAGNGQQCRAPVLGQVRLPGLLLRAAGAGAAPVLVQQPDGRLPEVRRPRGDPVLRPQARRHAAGRVAGRRRDSRLGQEEPVLFPDHRIAGRALRLFGRYAVERRWRRNSARWCSTVPGAPKSISAT